MPYPIKLVDIDLNQPIHAIGGLANYIGLQAFIRLHGLPIGFIEAPVIDGQVSAKALYKGIVRQHSEKIVQSLLENGLTRVNNPRELLLENLINVSPPEYEGELPSVTVAVCTRDRTADLKLCLESLSKLEYSNFDILVVDNAPSTNETEVMLRQEFAHIRYVCEPRPGLDWARNRAVLEASGEIIAFTDDDVIVDSKWVKSLARTFAQNPHVMALTGLVVPFELETESQVLFERYGGFGRGFERRFWQMPNKKIPWQRLGAGQYGTGANMAFRTCLFDRIGLFDPALDVGTDTNGGGDMELYFRVLKEGYTLVYEPAAIVRHRHRREMSKLHTQIANNGIGLYAFWVRCAINYPDEIWTILRAGIGWFWWWNLRRYINSFLRPSYFPRPLILAELKGCIPGLFRYQKARKKLTKIEKIYGPFIMTKSRSNYNSSESVMINNTSKKDAIAIRIIELDKPLQNLEDVSQYTIARVFVKESGRLLGSIDMPTHGKCIRRKDLIKALVDKFGISLLNGKKKTKAATQRLLKSIFNNRLGVVRENFKSQKLPTEVAVSVIVATYDRPDDLRQCLLCLEAQETAREVEIIVVDNNPSSGLTSQVVAQFPKVMLLNESRKGLSYARNTGFAASSGQICIATDDDVTMPVDWLEKLIAPFVRADVMVVTGNVLPLELENQSQVLFEIYGGLGKGFTNQEVDRKWFDSFPQAVPTWQLGATANAAFRTCIFSDARIGLLDEALGAGTPTGCSEDTYMFYKVLKAGYTLLYNADAYVWHHHRSNMTSFRNQLYNYSKGHAAYNLTTWLSDGDWRGLRRVLFEVPMMFLRRMKPQITGRSNYPFRLLLLEIYGHLAGPWALIQSRRRVKKLGRSKPYTQKSSTSDMKVLANQVSL